MVRGGLRVIIGVPKAAKEVSGVVMRVLGVVVGSLE